MSEPPSIREARRVLIASRDDGLGTRLLNLGWAWRVARKLGCRTAVIWPKAPAPLVGTLGGDMRLSQIVDLFSAQEAAPDLRVIEDELRLRPDWRHLDGTPGWKKKCFKLGPADLFGDSAVGVYTHYIPILLRGETLETAAAEVAALLRSLPLQPALQAASGRLLEGLDLSQLLSVHIRRGDIVEALKKQAIRIHHGADPAETDLSAYLTYYARKSGPKIAAIRYLDEHLRRRRRVVVSTDDPAVFDELLERYGKRVIRTDKATSLSPTQRTMLDILLMAQSRGILAPLSGFSRAASVIGETTLTPIGKWTSLDDYIRDVTDIALEATGSDRVAQVFGEALTKNDMFVRVLAKSMI